jgi:RNA-directed DNA polymerase
VADRGVVLMMPPKENSTRRVEGRPRPEGIPGRKAKVRTQGRAALPANLARVDEAARRGRQTQFTALLHHIDVDALRRSFHRQKKKASAGVDGITAKDYEVNLEENLKDLCDRVHSGRYRPQPVRRTYIPKADGGQRPLGVSTLEDKIVQSAVAELLSSIYEVDFLGFSYGFRPGRSPHQALDALSTAIMSRYVNWVLDADIRRFFDSVNHEWLMRMVAHRIADPRVLRLILQWLRAGVLESGEWRESVEGTPQGSGISPLLANIFLHYILDLWVQQWRKSQARGSVIFVRYCDDFVIGFQYEEDARQLWADLSTRLSKFGLSLHEDKTRLLEFGKFAQDRRLRRGQGRPETFNFLGFTHYCGKTRDGRFLVKRKTQRHRMIRKLKQLRVECRLRMHAPLNDQHKWLTSVLRGHYAYYGVPSNFRSLAQFLWEVGKIWLKALRRRSQRSGLNWDRFHDLQRRFPLPNPRITQPWSTASIA